MAKLGYLLKRSQDILQTEGPKRLAESGARFVIANVIESEKYYQIKYDLRQLRQQRKYGPVPHAFDIRFVSPKSIQRISRTTPSEKWKKAGLIESGNWDQTDKYFCNYDLYTAFKKRFDKGYSWENTDFHHRVCSQIEDGHIKWGCRTIEEFKARCEELDNLFKSIKEHGYMTRKELIENEHDLPSSDDFTAVSDSCLYKYDEVAVDIDRSGKFLFVDGRNRLAICKLLGVDKIPVRIVRRHTGWQKYRQGLEKGEVSKKQHPDLVDLWG